MVASAVSQRNERDRSNNEEGVSQTFDAIAYSKINSETTIYARKTNLNTKPQRCLSVPRTLQP
jgi:hypothetical protein